MASAILVSRNETSNFLSSNHHLQPRTMGKIPYFNPNPNPNPNFNTNHSNSFSKKQLNNHHHHHQNGNHHHHLHQISEDTLSFNHQNHHRKSSSLNDVTANGGGAATTTSFSHYINYDISTLSKSEIRNLKTRFIGELDRVRSLSTRIDSADFNSSKKRPPPSSFQPQSKRGKHQHNHQQQQQQLPQQQQPPVVVASAQVMKMCSNALSKVMKQKAGYVFNEPVDVVAMGLHDYHTIIKKPMDLGTIKKNLSNRVYTTPEEFAADVRLTFNNALKYNPKGHEVHTLAEKFLDKFEQIYAPIQQKFNVEKYQSRVVEKPLQQPVRKPKGGGDWGSQQKSDWVVPPKAADVVVVDEVQGSSWSRNPSPESQLPPPMVENLPKKPEPRPEPLPRVEPMVRPEPIPIVEPSPRPDPPTPKVEQPPPRREPTPRQEQPVQELVQTPVQEVVRSGTGRGSAGKLPKPKAKDPNKREMSMEEKHKLGAGLQSLPEEKMTQVIQIIRKRNGHLTQDGDEIELDIEAVDTETLWELDRFVTNYKKMVSKLRRQALMDMPDNNNVGLQDDDSNQVGVSERVTETSKAVKRSGGDVGEEDVDIGDEMPVHNFPPVEIEKDDDRHQGGGGGGGGGDRGDDGGETSDSDSSSSSGSDSSSSSDSDSGSSSGSDSDVEDAQSRDNESKNIPH